MLPLHAAGYHRRRGTGEAAMDRVVSSYIPTIRALAWARSRSTVLPPSSSLIVAMPVTPGGSALVGVMEEASTLRRRLPSPVTLMERDGIVDESTPTKDTVMARLADAAIAHFACHAASHPSDPSRSQILLHDRPLTVASLAPLRMPQAQLAYLSACETARNQISGLADEAIHLASAFQLAGYPHVIGTLWTIGDQIAARIADRFYTGLEREPQRLNLSRAGEALHHVIREIRSHYPAAPSLWAAYTHTGA
jgi:CHAT domain-containing protein